MKEWLWRPVDADDRQTMFNWRNDPETIFQSLTSAAVTSEEHRLWFALRLQKGRWWMLTELDRTPLGHIRLDERVVDSWRGNAMRLMEVSLTVGPVHRGKGHGKRLVSLVTQEAHREGFRCMAVVKNQNISSLKSFQSAGWERAKKQEYEGCIMLGDTISWQP